jgi:alpha-tubulin suppressor-like RCC1 family protein
VLEPRKVSARDVVSVSLGVTHSALITSNGSVFAGGTGRNGELGADLNEYVSGW